MVETIELVIYDGSREVTRHLWDGRRLVIGRSVEADIQLQDSTLSAMHAEIFSDNGQLLVCDLESLNGTRLNGKRVQSCSPLQVGDRIQVASATIHLRLRQADKLRSHKNTLFAEELTLPAESFDLLAADREQSKAPLADSTVKIRLDDLRSGAVALLDRRIALLRDLFEKLRTASGRDQILETVRGILEQAFVRGRVFVLQPTEDDGWHDEVVSEERPSMTFVAEVARSNSAMLSSALLKDQRFINATSVKVEGIQTAIAAPINCDGETVAVLYVDRLGLPAFGERDLHLLGIAANHVAAVLENDSRIAALERANQALEATRTSLAEMNQNLEQRVQERTAETRRQAAEIERLAAAKDELIGIAAHDIRGPLAVIQGTTELLQLRLDMLDADTIRRSLDDVSNTCRALTELLSELLDAKAIESGKITLQRAQTSVRELFDKASSVARLAAENKGIEVTIDAADQLDVDVDPQRIGQALTNLLLNAVKFSSPGTRILLKAEPRKGGGAAISVEDQGIGIPKSELGRLFGPFEQGQAGRVIGGSGLGLMIAKRLVELHGGGLDVSSEVGVGTRFTLSLP